MAKTTGQGRLAWDVWIEGQWPKEADDSPEAQFVKALWFPTPECGLGGVRYH